ncbi:L,D-transpeptidase [Bradyrhizobium sp. AUGA SZCCT0124]|uniref:L,D-transpeptidase n=1 Tax=unclassified Bradyrhizobium TaxID=2631580 RepID=UPI001BAAE5DA|nr:L,D-transpeptidase [Bradyrhizobium sp. AUGA SZCCT0124]MBR1315638.1 L,D-transpeptidase [Bradyrhizobium sp. AUGA SZCCT0051]MBR1338300.1 L,D-transpeptidase [Bradyrhizobium sp. AUGA SZCCT0105]MBR1355955.1 L,D-transpeptidase [Bradyrhizobium sp. AUGA SZCCT0045]
MRASGRRISIFDSANGRFWQFAILTAAGTVAASSQADAALFYWNRDSGYYGDVEPMPQQQPRPKPKRSTAKKNPAIEKEAGRKPQGPLIISVSIDQQRISIYDANGLYAESPVSTGMKGHSTPMGVFSVIQKQKYHQSNIYSGAPMPYMQRITWSGIAMHAGVLPNYPASHGCIRMPMSFAVKMYNWTRMGARVFVTPGTISPESFSHPLLVTQKVIPQQPVADEVLKMDAPLGVKSDKGADKQSSLDLRTSVGHAAAASLRDNTHTADASSAMPAASASATMSDASSSTARDAIAEKIAADKSETSATETAAADKPAETNSAAGDSSVANDDRTVGEVTGSTDTPKSEVSASDPVKAEAKADEPKPDAAKPGVVEAPKADASKADAAKDAANAANAVKTADEAAEAATAADAPDAKQDAAKDPARLPGVAKIDAPKRAGQIAVFISRKDSKLYVRQNFAPLFEAPVTIAASDRPLGTHVFTAEADKTDVNLLRWSVVTLPIRNAPRIDVEERAAHRRKLAAAAPAEVKPQPATDTPTEALDRISIPADAMARINEALGTGGSIIVSDLGVNQGETGEGTDFILPLR